MLIPEAKIRERVEVCGRTLRRWMAAGKFPLAVRVGRRALYWKSEDLQVWERKLSRIELPTEKQRGTTEEIEV